MKLGSRHSALGRSSSALGRFIAEEIPFTGLSHGSRAVVLIGGTNVTTYLHTADLMRTTTTHETNGLLSNSQTRIAGDNHAELNIQGYLDSTLKSTLGAIDRTITTWEYSPAGTALGTTTYSGKAKLKLHTTKSDHTKANTLDADLEVIGPVECDTN